MKSKKFKILSVLMCFVVLVSSILTGCNNTKENTEQSTMENTSVGATQKNEHDQTIAQSSSNVVTQDNEHNQTAVSLNDKKTSWLNMAIDNNGSSLTDDQKTVLQYFDNNYLYISDYKSLQRYPDIYKHARVEFNGIVSKILETNAESYTCLVSLYDFNSPSAEETQSMEDYIVVTGKHPSNGRIIEGDKLRFFGRYNDVQPYTIDEKKSYYPSISAFYSIFEEHEEKFDYSFIKKTAKILFGPDIKIEDPMSSPDYELDIYHPNHYSYFLITLDNQSNANFSSFEFSKSNGFIRDANIKDGIEKSISISADFNHYILITNDNNLNVVCVEYFDRDFKKLWSREFENTHNVQMDYTPNMMFLVTDNDLYCLDINTGKDIIPSVFVGKKVGINLIDDGAILIGEGKKDNIMKVDLNGEIVWKTSIDINTNYCTSLQIIDGNIIGYLYGYDTSEEYDDWGQPIEKHKQKMFCIDKDGNLVSEFDCNNIEELV